MPLIPHRRVWVSLLTLLGLCLQAQGNPGGPVQAPTAIPRADFSLRLPGAAFAAMETISPDHIRWHVRFLAHDLLEGRGTGQRGGDIAAEYMATQFAEYGLKPAGDNGSYLQKVPLVGVTTLLDTTFSLVPQHGAAMDLKPLTDYVAFDQTQQAQSDVE